MRSTPGYRGCNVEKLALNCSLWCDQIQNNHCYETSHTLLCYQVTLRCSTNKVVLVGTAEQRYGTGCHKKCLQHRFLLDLHMDILKISNKAQYKRQICFNKFGHLLVCKQSKRGREPQIFIHTL
jgi:hypothetical protein